jgi:hypothetical protein
VPIKDWEIIADNLSKAGWSWGCVSAINSNGQTIWIADAHRDDGKRFVVRADEKLTAFIELESAIHRQPASSQSAAQATPMLNSARGHCTSPRRGRRVERSDQ